MGRKGKEKKTHIGRLAVQLKKLANIKLGRLEDLSLPNIHVLKRINPPARLLDLAPDSLRNELLHELFQIAARRLARHDLEHLLPDLPDLRGLGVSGLLHLRRPAFGESDREEAEEVPVRGLHVHVRLDERLPFAHERAELVGSEVHPVEVGEAVLALDFVHAEFDLSEGLFFVFVQVRERDFDDAAFERVVGVFCGVSSI